MRSALLVSLLLLASCGGASPDDLLSTDLDAHVVARAQKLLPQLTRLSGGGGHGGGDGGLASQYHRRLETDLPLDSEAHATLLGALRTDVESWLEARGLRIAARGSTGDEAALRLGRFHLRYEGQGVIGWVFVDGIRTEEGHFALLLNLAEHR